MFSCAVSRSRRSRRLRRSRRGGTGRAVRNSESICALISSIFCLRYASGPPGPAVDGRRVCNISATPGRPKTVGSSAPNTSSSSKSSSRSAPSAPPDANSGSSRDPPVDTPSSKPRETSSRSKPSFSSRKFPDASRSVSLAHSSLAEASRSISVSWSTGSPTGSPSSFTSLHCTSALSSPPAETSHLLSPASGENRTHATLFECASSCSFAGAPGATHG